mgnify:CR=1 FL=1
MNWFSILKFEEDIKILEEILKEMQNLKAQSSKNAAWADKYYENSNKMTPFIWKYRETKPNEHIKMLLNDITELQDGTLGKDGMTTVMEEEEKAIEEDREPKKWTEEELGLEIIAEDLNDARGDYNLHREPGAEEW